MPDLFHSRSAEETKKFGEQLGQKLKAGDVVTLSGELGAGKTTFTKALAKEMGIKDEIVSPTFILHREYPGLDHIDCWRMEEVGEIEKLGLEKMIQEKHVIVIEWAEKVKKVIKRLRDEGIKVIWIKIGYGDKKNERRMSCEDIGN